MDDEKLLRQMNDTVHQALEQDARHIGARMPKINKERVKAFPAELKEFMAINGLKQTDLVKRIKVSTAAISQLLRGKYQGNVPNLIRKLSSFMDTYQRRKRRQKGPRYVDTSIAKAVFTLIKQTESFSDEREGKIGLVIGDSGHGKSICLRQYAEWNVNSVYVELDDTMTSTAIFAKIAKTLRTDRGSKIDDTGALKKLTGRLADELENREITIMLDEASALDVRKLNQLRQVITVRCKCPLIISGNSHLLKTINDDAGRRGFESLDQFRSRLLAIVNLDELAASTTSKGSKRVLYNADDIRRLYEYAGVRLTKDGIATLQRICRTPLTGRLRTCSIIIEALHLSPKIVSGKTSIDTNWIVAAIRDLGLPIFDRLPLTVPDVTGEEVKEAVVKAG